MTITRRILLQIALAATSVILVASGVTYRLVYRNAEQEGLNHLRDYVAERARVEETKLLHVRENLEMVRGIFLRRNAAPPPRDYQAQWDRWFEKHPDGAWRTRREFADARQYSSSWVGKTAMLTPELMTQMLRAQTLCNDMLPAWVDTFPSLYFVFPCQANIGFDPRIPEWVWQTPADYDNNAIEAVASANVQNNPSRQIVWNGVIEEPISRQPYITVALPIDVDGQNIAMLGHDINALRLLDDATRSSLRGVTHFIFHPDGRLIAHREKMPQIIAAAGHYTMQASDDATLRNLYAATHALSGRLATGYEKTGGVYFAVARLAGPEWLFLSTMPRQQLHEQAFASAQWVLWSGLLSLALVLGFFATVLRRQIAQPLAAFLGVTRRLAAGETGVRMGLKREDEIGQLAEAFNDMEEKIEARGAALRDSEQRWRALFEQSPLSVQIFAPDGSTRLVNAAYEKFWHVSLPMLAQYNVLHDPQLEENGVAPLLRRAFAGEVVAVPAAPYDPGRTPNTPLDAAGERWLSALLYPLLDEQGRVREVICLHEDITDRKKAEDQIRALNQSLEQRVTQRTEELQSTNRELQQEVEQRKRAEAELATAVEAERELNAMKSSFISMVSHEFRTPLGVIVSAADVLDRYLDRLPPEERREHLAMIFRSVKNLTQLVENVLLLGKVEGGRLPFKPAPIDLCAFAHQLSDEICSATSARCPIDCAPASALEDAFADADLLRHILTNLLSNAVKYSEPGSPVALSIERRGDDAIFTVRDRGIGIPEEDRKQLFSSFARGGNVGERPGSGLGLLIVKRCAELHGGTVAIESEAGRGTTVTVALPLFPNPKS